MRTWQQSNNNSCSGKKVFITFQEALNFERKMRKRGSPKMAQGKKLEHLHPYKCLKCGNFHLGHYGSRKNDYR